MSVYRIAKRQRFTVVDRRTVNDDRLSFKARGVLVWLLDKPDDWSITREGLIAAGPDGQSAMRGALKELTDAGYLVRTRVRGPHGRVVTETMLYEVPGEGYPQDLPPLVDNQPSVDRPAVDRPAKSLELKSKTESRQRNNWTPQPAPNPIPPPFEPLPPRPPVESSRAALADLRRKRA